MTKSRLRRKGLISPAPPANSPSLREFKARTYRQELMEEPWGITAHWLSLLRIAGPAFLQHPDHQPTSSAAHIDWALPTSIVNGENAPLVNRVDFLS